MITLFLTLTLPSASKRNGSTPIVTFASASLIAFGERGDQRDELELRARDRQRAVHGEGALTGDRRTDQRLHAALDRERRDLLPARRARRRACRRRTWRRPS